MQGEFVSFEGAIPLPFCNVCAHLLPLQALTALAEGTGAEGGITASAAV